MNWYKKAQLNQNQNQEIITGPDMANYTPSKIEEVTTKLKEKYPRISWTLEKVKVWMNDHFEGELPSIKGPLDISQRPLD